MLPGKMAWVLQFCAGSSQRTGGLVGIPGGREVPRRNYVEENGLRLNGQRQCDVPCQKGSAG